jgi:hypothetical protein
MNANLRYWKSIVLAAEAELDAATTNSELKLAARRLLRARESLKTLTMRRPPRNPEPSLGHNVTDRPATDSAFLRRQASGDPSPGKGRSCQNSRRRA